MRYILWLICSCALLSCGGVAKPSEGTNRWADERLWPVLEAQDHRDVPTLCAFFTDSSADVRAAAALAFASISGEVPTGCLLEALADRDAFVRAAAAFALGFTADSSATVKMAEIATEERDTTVQRALLNASFIAMQRSGILKDPNAIIYYFEHAHGQARVRAVDALRRLPDSVLQAMAPDYLDLFKSNVNAEEEAMLVRGLGKLKNEEATVLLRFSTDQDKPAVIIPCAIRALGALQNRADDSLFFWWVGPGCIGQAALEVLRGKNSLDANVCFSKAAELSDPASRIAMLGLAMKHGDAALADSARALLDAISGGHNPYNAAEAIMAIAQHPLPGDFGALMKVMTADAHPAERQAAFLGVVRIVRDNMMRSRFASREAQYEGLRDLVTTAVNTKDAGLICAVAELLQEEEADVIQILLPRELEEAALKPLQPIRDLEARLLLQKATAKRDGLQPPVPERLAFNHPIDKTKLLALKQGQQYRIVTNKGDIIIATDVNECPGSSLAFDSLVVAGYYNGKAFHRVVPNFVIQGGCPRGDGYGGMPWTLRTEIGRAPFSAGSVGLASAGPDTESCQFFITHSAAPHLDGHYTRFGEVVSGMDVVWKIQVGDVMTRVERIY